jgi:hypothetical protein
VRPESFESALIENVHVIGDACIGRRDAKSASAANSQALRCARAIVASLREQELPSPQFDSVCYSLLGRDLRASRFTATSPLPTARSAKSISRKTLTSPARRRKPCKPRAGTDRIVAESFGT